MTNEELNRIIDRYLAGQATEEEKRLVEAFFEVVERKQPDPDAAETRALWEKIAARIESPKPRGTVWRSLAVLAGSLVVVLLLGYLGYSAIKRGERELITRSAPFGEKSIVMLTDGTRVFLNSGSSISYPRVFNDAQRQVTLEGEAFFDVKPNPEQPFVVRTGDLVTRVLGTSFNITAFDANDISVTVATGRVQVFEDSGMNRESGDSIRSVFLDPEQRISYQNHAFTLTRVDVQQEVAWRNNILRFDETPLSRVGSMLERWYGVHIAFDNNDIVNCRINGKFKDQRLEEVLKSIRYMYNIDYDIVNPNKIILYGKGCKN